MELLATVRAVPNPATAKATVRMATAITMARAVAPPTELPTTLDHRQHTPLATTATVAITGRSLRATPTVTISSPRPKRPTEALAINKAMERIAMAKTKAMDRARHTGQLRATDSPRATAIHTVTEHLRATALLRAMAPLWATVLLKTMAMALLKTTAMALPRTTATVLEAMVQTTTAQLKTIATVLAKAMVLPRTMATVPEAMV